MSKEMMIVFVYDTRLCAAEDADPADAVLYFHPGWVSDTQRHALAGQVVGAAHCVKALFSPPVAITLQSGKFILKEYGRYILAVGSDRNIPEWVLAARAALLARLVRVQHGGLAALGARLGARLPDKLYHMFETYLPVLQYGSHIFQRVPMLALPKSGAALYLECVSALDQCRALDGALGGLVLYNNKIVCSQLPARLASALCVADPARVRSPAEPLRPRAPLPPAAQLLLVYVPRAVAGALRARAARLRALLRHGEDLVAGFRQSQEAERDKFPAGGMKRDQSLLFTAVPEEEPSPASPPAAAPAPAPAPPAAPAPDVVPFANKPRPRPTKLSLAFRTQPSLDEECCKENGAAFTGQTSVASTPAVECKRLHGAVLSICRAGPARDQRGPDPADLRNIENCDRLNLENERDKRVVLDLSCAAEHYVPRPEPARRPASAATHRPGAAPAAARAPGPATIADPSFPVFRSDGRPVSEALFAQYLEQHYSGLECAPAPAPGLAPAPAPAPASASAPDSFPDFDSELARSPPRSPPRAPPRAPAPPPASDQSRRSSLSLPLKPLNAAGAGGRPAPGVLLTPLMERLSHAPWDKSSGYSSRGGTPLEGGPGGPRAGDGGTHLYSHSSRGSCPRDEDSDSASSGSSSSEADEADGAGEAREAGAEPCALLVCGAGEAALLLLLETDAALAGDAVTDLWETAMTALGSIEAKCLEMAARAEPADYSYLALDPDWGAVSAAGPWPPADLAALGLLHHAFRCDPELAEFVLRSEDSVVVGGACGRAETYYREAGARAAGPPAPADLLAAAPGRARRRLRRDHSLLLL